MWFTPFNVQPLPPPTPPLTPSPAAVSLPAAAAGRSNDATNSNSPGRGSQFLRFLSRLVPTRGAHAVQPEAAASVRTNPLSLPLTPTAPNTADGPHTTAPQTAAHASSTAHAASHPASTTRSVDGPHVAQQATTSASSAAHTPTTPHSSAAQHTNTPTAHHTTPVVHHTPVIPLRHVKPSREPGKLQGQPSHIAVHISDSHHPHTPTTLSPHAERIAATAEQGKGLSSARECDQAHQATQVTHEGGLHDQGADSSGGSLATVQLPDAISDQDGPHSHVIVWARESQGAELPDGVRHAFVSGSACEPGSHGSNASVQSCHTLAEESSSSGGAHAHDGGSGSRTCTSMPAMAEEAACKEGVVSNS